MDKIYSTLIKDGSYLYILKGLSITVSISFFSVIFGTILGMAICGLRLSKIKSLNIVSRIYVSVLQGSPVTMLLMLLYYVVFAKSNLKENHVAVITFSLNMAAYVAEMLRSAIMSINKREIEAARTLGFNGWQTFYLVTFPQARKAAAPVYKTGIINLIQWTSVLGYITISDLTKVINNISSRTMQPLLMIITGMILYIMVAYFVEGIFFFSQKVTDWIDTRRCAK